MGRADREALEKRIREGEEKERKQRRRERREKLKQERVSFLADFKKFITKGNVLDMAVAVVVATAFNAIVNGLVKQIITPLVTYFTSGVSINEWEYVLREEITNADGVVEQTKISIQYGFWLQTVLDFLIIAFTVFVLVRVIKGMERKLKAKEIAQQEAEAAVQKAEADAKAAEDALAAAEQTAKEQAIKDEFYANIREQSELLREIRDSVRKEA